MVKKIQIIVLLITVIVLINTFTVFGQITDKIGEPSNLSDIERYFSITTAGREKLFEQGFIVLADFKSDNLAQSYYSLELKDELCVFLTTDAILSLLYAIQENLLKTVEKDYLYNMLEQLCLDMQEKCTALVADKNRENPIIKDALEDNLVFFTVACHLLDKSVSAPEDIKNKAAEIVKKVNEHKETGYHPDEDYTQYKVRGYYKGDPQIERYFKCMKWLSRKIFHVNDKRFNRELVQAAVIAIILKDNPQIEQEWKKIYEVITLFINPPDSITPLMVQEAITNIFGEKFDLNILTESENLTRLRKEFEKPEYPDSVIVPLLTSPEDLPMLKKYIQFMGERYVPDSEVFSQVSAPYVEGRFLPKGLDIMATILESERAEEHLQMDIEKYTELRTKLQNMKTKFSKYSEDDWRKSIYNNWLYSLKILLKEFDQKYPFFMQTKAWQDEKLNTALSSWAQLRHLYILYTKHTYTAAGLSRGGGYIEPIPEFYKEVAGLLQRVMTTLSERDVFPVKYRDLFKEAIDGLNGFAKYAQKEIDGESLTDQEKSDIHYFGSWLMNFEIKEPMMVADVCTDSYNKQVLHAGTGYYNPIVVIFKDDKGNSQAAIGYVMSYYEFVEKDVNRLDDAQWKERLKTGAEDLRPEWTKNFLSSSGVKKSQGAGEQGIESFFGSELMSSEEKEELAERIENGKEEQVKWRLRFEEERKKRNEDLRKETDPEKRAKILMELSSQYGPQDLEKAIQGYQEIISTLPGSTLAAEASLKIAELYEEIYGYQKSKEFFPEEIEMPLFKLPDIKVSEPEIVKAYMDVVEKYPRDKHAFDALCKLGDFYYYKQNNPQLALPYYKKLIKDFPAESDVHRVSYITEIYSKLIMDHYWEKKHEEALKLYEEFMSFRPYLALCSESIFLTSFYGYPGKLELKPETTAKAQLIKAGSGFDWQTLGLFTNAENRIELEDYQGAISILEKILQLYPDWKLINNVSVLNEWCSSMIGRVKNAYRLESLIKEDLLDEVRQKAFLGLGNVYLNQKDFIAAVSAYQRAIEVTGLMTEKNKNVILGLMSDLRRKTEKGIDLPPLIYNIKFSSEQISWSTDIPATSKICYGVEENMENMIQFGERVQDIYKSKNGNYHYNIKIVNKLPDNQRSNRIIQGKELYLEPDKEYHFQIICETEQGVSGQSGKYSLFIDTQGPNVSLISPQGDAVLDGEAEFEAKISDNAGIAEVVFCITENQHPRKLAYMTEPPFRKKVDLNSIKNGYYNFGVWAKDIGGNKAHKDIRIRIMNSTGDVTSPKVKIIFPQDGAVVSGEVKIIAEATDDMSGIDELKFFINGNEIASRSSPPYEDIWDTLIYDPGIYRLQAKAIDHADNSGESEIITVTVKETPEYKAEVEKRKREGKSILELHEKVPIRNDMIDFVEPFIFHINVGVPTKISWKIVKGVNVECTDLRWDYLLDLKNRVEIEDVVNYRYKGKTFSGKGGQTFTDEILLDDAAKPPAIMLAIHAIIDDKEMRSYLLNIQIVK